MMSCLGTAPRIPYRGFPSFRWTGNAQRLPCLSQIVAELLFELLLCPWVIREDRDPTGDEDVPRQHLGLSGHLPNLASVHKDEFRCLLTAAARNVRI